VDLPVISTVVVGKPILRAGGSTLAKGCPDVKRFVLLALLLFGANAHADGMLPGGATLKFNKLLLHENNSSTAAEPEVDPDSIWGYFNLAHCVCSFFNNSPDSADPTFYEDTFAYEMTIENYTTPINRPVEFWVGTDCANTDSNIRDTNCTSVGSLDVSAIGQAGVGNIEISVYDVMVPKPGDRPGCQERLQSSTTWALVDADADSTFEYSLQDIIETDAEPPPLPTNFKATGAENAINISWDAPAAGVADIYSYQALCATTLSGAPAKTSPPAARYQTARGLCGAQQDIALMPSDIETTTSPDAGTGSIQLPQELAQLDKAFVCGESTSSTALSMRIDGLKNGVEYTVVLLAIDKYGNASGTYFTSSLVPQPATDFWEDLHDQGSGVEGGFCLIAQAYGDGNPLTGALRSFRDATLAHTAFGRLLIDAYYGTVGSLDLHGSIVLRIIVGLALLPFVAFALLWHVFTLPGLALLLGLGLVVRRFHKRRGVPPRLAAAATMVALFVLMPRHANAQSPYWENASVPEDDAALGVGDPQRVTWHAGIRVGPYIPGIDAQLDMPAAGSAGPYEAMFGGYAILPMLDVERFFWKGFGQLGAGVSIGYMGRKAHPWQAGSDPNDKNRPRSAGDDNTFRLFPLSVNAVYRLTVLDDEYGIPLIPYARAGLAYYVWWVTAPSGDFAKTCTSGGSDPMCATTSARGASLGVVGSIGLAIRAERIDTSAARSMHESGIEHAGFYGEYSVGKVDGFGSDKKLSVGDATWFAGVDFEF
jgi:hypothetical protein